VELAVDHYFGLLSADLVPSDAFCLTAVQGLTVDEALERFDGCPGWAVADLAELGNRAAAVYPDDLPTVVADEVDGWVLLAESNGWHGAKTSVLQRLSAGTVVASAFWNVNRDSTISLARDGEVLAAFDFVIDGNRPPRSCRIWTGWTSPIPTARQRRHSHSWKRSPACDSRRSGRSAGTPRRSSVTSGDSARPIPCAGST
jgi:hypothetical protein